MVIRVEAVSIEGGDVLNRAGGMLTGDRTSSATSARAPSSEVGEKAAAAGAAEGQRVVATMANGSHAELVSVPFAATWPIPDGADLIACACVPVAFGTADDCLFEFGRLREGETVLVQAGGGGVGMAAIQLAKRAGATVLATASSDDKLARIADLGVDHGINYGEHDAADEARRLTDGRGVDLVVDSVGGSTLQGSLRALAYRGRAITVGNAGRERIAIDVSPLMGINGSLTGVFLGAEMATPRVREMIGRAHRRRRRAAARGARRPHVPAVRRGRRARLHREPRRGRAGRADSLRARGGGPARASPLRAARRGG